MEQNAVLISILSTIGLGLLVVVTVGVVYLTLVDWRDRRRKDSDTKVRR